MPQFIHHVILKAGYTLPRYWHNFLVNMLIPMQLLSIKKSRKKIDSKPLHDTTD